MKRKLPNNSLRDKMDATPQEFEEAHWENLAAMLHEEEGLSRSQELKQRNRFFGLLGALLFFGAMAGMFYFNKTEKPVKATEVSTVASSDTKKDLTAKESETIAATESNVLQSKNIERPSIEDSENQKIKTPSLRKKNIGTTAQKVSKNLPIKDNKKTRIKKSSSNNNTAQGQDLRSNDLIPTSKNKVVESIVKEAKQELFFATALEKDKRTTSNSKIFPNSSKEEAKQGRQKTQSTPLLETSILPLSTNASRKLEFLSHQKNPWKGPRKKLRVGFLTGFNFSNGKPGLTIGVSLERRLSPQWYLELDMTYRGSHIDIWEIDPANLMNHDETYFAKSINLLRYRDFPLMIKWRPQQRFSFYAGPKLAFLMQAAGEVNTEVVLQDNPSSPPLVERRVTQGIITPSTIRGLRTVEWGAVLGATVHLDKNIGLGLRGHFGITPIVDDLARVPNPQKRNLDLQFLVQLYF